MHFVQLFSTGNIATSERCTLRVSSTSETCPPLESNPCKPSWRKIAHSIRQHFFKLIHSMLTSMHSDTFHQHNLSIRTFKGGTNPSHQYLQGAAIHTRVWRVYLILSLRAICNVNSIHDLGYVLYIVPCISESLTCQTNLLQFTNRQSKCALDTRATPL